MRRRPARSEGEASMRALNVATLLAATGIGLIGAASWAADPPAPRPFRELRSLKGLLPPTPTAGDYAKIVADKAALARLGKALFWDQMVGNRGDQACASCHFHAGADPRTANQQSPGLNIQPAGDPTFGGAGGLTGSGAKAGPNYPLVAGDFPFHRLSDPDDRQSPVAFDSNDVTSSAGAYQGGFMVAAEEGSPNQGDNRISIRGKGKLDPCSVQVSTIFTIAGPAGPLNTRKVEPRNTPTVVDAVFNRRNFWDGRANNSFNGFDPFGPRSLAFDPLARIVRVEGGQPSLQALDLPNMSAASQADGPPRSDFEMACSGRTFDDIGRRLLPLKALSVQQVSGGDSALGAVAAVPKGLRLTYKQLVEAA